MYGTAGLNVSDYPQFVGLSLNLPRARARLALDLLDVFDMATGKRLVPEDYFRCRSDSPREVAEMIADQGRDLVR